MPRSAADVVPARISLVTLGVADVARSRDFYRALGWQPALEMEDYVVVRTAGSLLALWPQAELSRSVGQQEPGHGSAARSTTAVNLASPAEVDTALDEAVAAGATVLAPAADAEWGGYTGSFADPDGHVWEVAYNPGWPLGDDGLPRIP